MSDAEHSPGRRSATLYPRWMTWLGLSNLVVCRGDFRARKTSGYERRVHISVGAVYRWRTGPFEGPAIESYRLCRWIVTFENRELTLRTLAQILAR